MSNWKTPNADQLALLKDQLQKANLCYEDISDLRFIQTQIGENNEVQAGFAFEKFESDALFRSVIIAPSARGKGNGQSLISEAIGYAKLNGIQNLYLLTTTASGFFAKNGFITIPRDSVPESIANTSEFKDFCPDSATCMKLELSNL